MFTMGPPMWDAAAVGDPFAAFVKLQIRFEGANGGTVFSDDSGTSSPAGFNGVTTSNEQAKFGSTSAKFPNSSNDSVVDGSEFPTNLAAYAHSFSTSATFECFVYFISGSGTQYILHALNNNSYETFVARMSDGSILARYASATSTTVATGLLPLNQWHHIAIVSQGGSNSKLYVNGVLAATLTNGSTSPLTTAAGIKIGNWPFGSGNVRGYIDSVRITIGAARYTADFTPPATEFPIP